ncbi:hypothetical protein GPALN_010135 [Globodera pallida]|nr:hypothetical protein GPALN_010135 [Globodera pallida]
MCHEIFEQSYKHKLAEQQDDADSMEIRRAIDGNDAEIVSERSGGGPQPIAQELLPGQVTAEMLPLQLNLEKKKLTLAHARLVPILCKSNKKSRRINDGHFGGSFTTGDVDGFC